MRIIAQQEFGAIDINYDFVCVSISVKDPCLIIAYPIMFASDNAHWKIAKYSTSEKAEKALEMLKEKYLSYLRCDGGLTATANCYVQPFAFVQPKVFQFPADEDVTVVESYVEED